MIKLTKGQWTIVNEADYFWLCRWKWCAHWEKNTNTFYACRSAKSGERKTTVWMHREILGLIEFDGKIGDHIDRVRTLDNRRMNLRIANTTQSVMNTGIRKTNKCGVKGVSLNNGTYMVRIGVYGQKIYIGRRKSLDEAKALSIEAQRKYHGEFACSE